MAVDSRNKRASVIQFQQIAPVFPTPDSDLANEADRSHMLHLFAAAFDSATAQCVVLKDAIAGLNFTRSTTGRNFVLSQIRVARAKGGTVCG